MNKSKNIVLILSENFTKSSWCQFEVLLAHNRFVKQVADSLVSIKLEDIAHDLMTNSLEILIKFALSVPLKSYHWLSYKQELVIYCYMIHEECLYRWIHSDSQNIPIFLPIISLDCVRILIK
jgi:hypothetical protein